LGLAAVIGRRFTHSLLAAASQLPEASLVLILDELWQRQIIREQGDDGYDFSHDIIRQVTLSRLSVPRKRWAHQQVAAALQQLSANDLEAAQGQIAGHLAAARQKQDAAQHFIHAAANAPGLYAHHEAIRHLQRALAMLPASDSRRAAIHGARGEAFLLLGN